MKNNGWDNAHLRTAFAARVKHWREDRGMTQAALAEAMNTHAAYVGHIEQTLINPSLGTIVALADALRINPARLVDGLSLTSSDRA